MTRPVPTTAILEYDGSLASNCISKQEIFNKR